MSHFIQDNIFLYLDYTKYWKIIHLIHLLILSYLTLKTENFFSKKKRKNRNYASLSCSYVKSVCKTFNSSGRYLLTKIKEISKIFIVYRCKKYYMTAWPIAFFFILVSDVITLKFWMNNYWYMSVFKTICYSPFQYPAWIPLCTFLLLTVIWGP